MDAQPKSKVLLAPEKFEISMIGPTRLGPALT